MSNFIFTCPFCGLQWECKDDWENLKIQCPQCKNDIIITKKSGCCEPSSKLLEIENNNYLYNSKNRSYINKEYLTLKSFLWSLILIPVAFFIILSMFSSCRNTKQKEQNKSGNIAQKSVEKPIDFNAVTNDAPFTRSQVINEAKKAIRVAGMMKDFPEHKINEIIRSMQVQHVLVDRNSGVVHSTVRVDGVRYLYSIEFVFRNGKMIPNQVAFDRDE